MFDIFLKRLYSHIEKIKNRGAVFMIICRRGLSGKGKGKIAEESKFPQNLLIWAQGKHLCDCRGFISALRY